MKYEVLLNCTHQKITVSTKILSGTTVFDIDNNKWQLLNSVYIINISVYHKS